MDAKSGPLHVLHQSPVGVLFPSVRCVRNVLHGMLIRTVLRRVEVQYYRFTPDECLVLHEMQRWATPDDRANAGFEIVEDDDEEVSDVDDGGDVMDWE